MTGARWLACAGLMGVACSDAASKERVYEVDAAIRSSGQASGSLLVARLDARIPRTNLGLATSLHATRVTFGARSSEGFEVIDVDSGVSVRAFLVGLPDVATEHLDGHVVFPTASTVSAVHRTGPAGTEDFVFLDAAPPSNELRYAIMLGAEVAGLRLVERTLELLDPSGTPRLRVTPPYVIDAAGTRFEAELEVVACAVDRSPAMPWGRAVVDPGARRCVVRVSFPSAVRYPAIVDPAWLSTGKLAAPRDHHAAALLKSGKVLLAAGLDDSAGTAIMSSAELFDGVTRTFAATGSMKEARHLPSMVALSGGDALVLAGITSASTLAATQERYDAALGTWKTVAPDPSLPRTGQTMTELAGGAVLVTGGWSPVTDAHLYDPATNVWTAVGKMTTPRGFHAATLLASGKVLVAGGAKAVTSDYDSVSTAEIYDPTTKVWTATGSMAEARHGEAAMILPGVAGKVLVAGGRTKSVRLSTAELFDPALGTWSTTASMGSPRGDIVFAPYSGNVLAVGGSLTTFGVEIYTAASGTWNKGPDPVWGWFQFMTATTLPSGAVFVHNGYFHTEVLPVQFALGSPCKIAGDCVSGYCVDDVCCDGACTGGCMACSAARKAAGADGACGPEKAGTDLRSKCTDDGAPACGKNGLCDGAGGCQTYPGTGCVPRPCTTGTECTSGACSDGICCEKVCDGPCEACTKASKGGGGDGSCGPIAAGSDPRARCPADAGFPASCKSDGLCDGAGACRAFAPTGTSCGTSTCKDGAASGSLCNGSGSCVASAIKCDPFVCKDASSCATSCATDAQCATGLFCEGGLCKPKKALGAAAIEARECASGFVADSVCCNVACAGPCEACDAKDTKGTCALVVGPARHGKCPTAPSGGDPCAAARCDGVSRDKCAAFAGPEVTCRAPSCVDGDEISVAICAGSGKCPALKTRRCDPYVCDADACRTSCTTDAHCAKGSKCDVPTGKCIGGSTCDGDHTVTSPSGTKSDCSPFRCDDTGCRSRCDDSTHCVAGFACDSATNRCTPAAAPSADSGGCGVASNAPASGFGFVAAAFVAAANRRRRRSVTPHRFYE